MISTLSRKFQDELLDLTNQPTASGREDAVIQWVQRWIGRRSGVKLRRDRFGNMLIQRQQSGGGQRRGRPLLVTAHLDHPAFVVTEVKSEREIVAEFRGGVADRYFEGSPVRLWQDGEAVRTGVVETLHPAKAKEWGNKHASIRLNGRANARPGDIVTWRLPGSRLSGDRLRAPVCDDLAGVAAALQSFDQWRRSAGRQSTPATDFRVLLTRCEEVGLIGAMAACQSGLIPKRARLVLLENSKSFAESPIGGGPIVRVGDRTSIFDPGLTYEVTQIARQITEEDATFRFQRKLMPGGTCEATAYQSLGYTAGCLCLPLGNYHNQNENTGRIDRETISLSDYQALLQLLVEIARKLDAPSTAPSLRQRLDRLYQRGRHMLEG